MTSRDSDKLVFNEDKHTYTRRGERYANVSSIVKKYSPPFKKEFLAGLVAKRDGLSVSHVIAMWAANGELSMTYGNAVDLAVRYLIDFGDLPNPIILKRCMDSFAEITLGIKMKANVMLSHDEVKLAGTADIFKQIGDDHMHIDIEDVKTNADLEKSYGKMLPPFDDLRDSPFNKYRLQLSLYKFLAEYEGYTVDNLALWHWTDVWSYVPLEPLDLTVVIEDLLEPKRELG